MTDLERAQEQVRTATSAFEYLQHLAVQDRKLAKDGHTNGHFIKALQEVEKAKKHYEDLLHRAEARS